MIHLKPVNPDFPPEVRRRSTVYQDLACATGGGYPYLPRADLLSDERVSNLLSTVATVDLGDQPRSFDLTNGPHDTRVLRQG